MIHLFYHGGSTNHGCEAIVRSTKKIIGSELILHTTNIDSDRKYNLDMVVTLEKDSYSPPARDSLRYFLFAVHHKLTQSDYLFTKFAHNKFFSNVRPGHVYLSIGGDNYCYDGKDILGHYNRILHKKEAKTILWGCSFESDDINKKTITDLARYNLIISRESISYEALRKINPNTVLMPDPAFQLDTVELPLPSGFIAKNTVGINVSPLIMHYEKNQGITIQNYRNLICHIIENTDMQVALIPHVVEPENDDRTPLRILYEEFQFSKRVVMIDDCNAMELKGYIARCRFFVGARTHATIAAYSTCVPTLVVGYSVKAKGIAKDIFGTDKNYVVSVQSLQYADDLVRGFQWLKQQETNIVDHLKSFMPSYCARVLNAGDLVRRLTQ